MPAAEVRVEGEETLQEGRIYLSQILSAFSFALDLTEGAVPGHALRSCLLGMRLAAAAGVEGTERRELYYALLLKDIGCSSNAARLCQIVGGDERAVKAGVKLVDWTKSHITSTDTLKLLWGTVLPEAHSLQRAARMVYVGISQQRINTELITTRCDRGASIVRKLGLGPAAAAAVRSLDEHWDGGGYPEGRKGAMIPLFGRILLLAQHLDVFSTRMSPEGAIAVMQERSGTWSIRSW